MFSEWSVQSGYKEMFGSIEHNSIRVEREESSFGMPACRVMIFGAQELK
jgi:hypothetical protein